MKEAPRFEIENRLGLIQQWRTDIAWCSQMYGTDEYIVAVERLRSDMVDIPDGPPLRTLVDAHWEYLNRRIEPRLMDEWRQQYRQESAEEADVRAQEVIVQRTLSQMNYKYILHVLTSRGYNLGSVEEEDVHGIG